MGRFYVGQRVRIINCQRYMSYKGKEAVVIEYINVKKGTICSNGFPLLMDVSYIIECEDNRTFSVADWHLEPITDSYDIVTWEECLWQPSPETV